MQEGFKWLELVLYGISEVTEHHYENISSSMRAWPGDIPCRLCPCPCAFTAQHSVTRDMITDSREDLTNSVAQAVKEHRGKFRGLDCNRGTKTVMKRSVRDCGLSVPLLVLQ